MADERELLRESFRQILERDAGLRDQLDKFRGLTTHHELESVLASTREHVGALESRGADSQLALETIVNRVGRPVLEVANDDYLVEGPEATIWEARLSHAAVRAALRQVIPSVGRIEVDHHPDFTWVGTGWLIADDVLVTNRHVASEFAALSQTPGGPHYVFRRGWPDRTTRMAARVDFRRELRNSDPRAFAVREVLHIEEDDGPDFAFLRVERTGTAGALSAVLRTDERNVEAQEFVATVGYPAADSRIPEHDLMSRLFGDKYNVKRLAPGQVIRQADGLVLHDCTTLGGNSGSPIVDLATGAVLGLHFSGLFLRENRGVPIGYVTSRLRKVLRPLRPTDDRPEAPGGAAPATPTLPLPAAVPTASGGVLSWTIPLQVSVSLGMPAAGISAATLAGTVRASGPAPGTTLEQAVAEVQSRLQGQAEVLMVRDGYQFRNGWITPDPAVVVIVQGRGVPTASDLGLPTQVQGFPVEVRAASPWDLAESQRSLLTLEGVPPIAYRKPDDFSLEEVDETMTVTCHVSPDAGWPTLRGFLAGTGSRLTVGMYDFTAPHIVDGIRRAVENAPRRLSLVMQDGAALTGKPNDIPEEETIASYQEQLGDRFDFAPASVGRGRQFASAYHIKVAVRDGKAFWLSSGNWQSSNQPDHDVAVGEASWDLLLRHNREWHVVIENASLARQFEKYLQYDLENARADERVEAVAPPEALFLLEEAVEERVPTGRPKYFAPRTVQRRVRVRPLLTPDNYQEHVLALIQSAERRLLFQNQSLSLLGVDADGEDKNDERFAALVDALLAKHREGVDVRIIIRGEFAPIGPLEQLQKRGFDMAKVRLQNRCHTKGIIVDGARVLIGSHNWTNQGTLVNRDASLIFDDEEIAQYFEEIFWFDWKHLTRQSVRGRGARRVRGDEEVPNGMRLVSWQEIVHGD